MDKDRMKGKAEDVKGRVKRQVGEWTGDTEAQVKGAAQQVKGKVQNAWGKAKDAGREALEHSKPGGQAKRHEAEQHRKDKSAA